MAEFISELAILKSTEQYESASGGLLKPSEAAKKIFGRLDGCTLFAYMFRRFGYSVYGWDGYKGLASYLITTPTDGIYLRVDPRINTTDVEDTELMFGYAIDEDKFQKLIDEQLRIIPDYFHYRPQSSHGLYLFQR
jgi:hypothetical protein